MSIKNKKSLVQIVLDGNERWYHIRTAGKKLPDSVIAREIPQLPDTLDEILKTDASRFVKADSLHQYSYPEINDMNVVPIKANEIKSDDLTMWTAIRDRIRAHDSNSNPQTVVPITSLRRCYDFLRTNSNDAIQRCMARGFDIHGLMNLWNESINQLQNFQPGCSLLSNNQRADLELREDPLGSTNDLVKRLIDYNNGQVVFKDQTLAYVTRELNPLRTEGGVFETGHAASNSGSGGMDLLLVSNDGQPVVGEIKINEDMNPFFALIQSLTYAAELSTPNQLNRLRDPDAFGDTFKETQNDGPQVGICIIIARYPDESDKKRYLAKTKQLADELVAEGIVFRADLLKAELDGDRLDFTPIPVPDQVDAS